jgi:putative transposase
MLDPWPVDRPQSWLTIVNRPLPAAEAQRLKESLTRGRPFGSEQWTEKTAARLGLQYTPNPRGRPKKQEETS